jgi:DNA gyrase subunit A
LFSGGQLAYVKVVIAAVTPWVDKLPESFDFLWLFAYYKLSFWTPSKGGIERMPERIERTYIEDEMRESYINYAMSVIRGRAIPDVRDGLKPVQRRILYGMYQLGLMPNRPHKKSARIVGEVMGKYHPHGDQAVYDTMVNMAQEFSFRYPLIDGQGNFGSIDGDEPAAMRYTEARLAPIAEEFLAEIEENTVDFVPNFDDSLTEPVVLPSKVPNLLINGSWGISVGMTTQIPPHNLAEVVEALVHLIERPEAPLEEFLQYIKGPDFPTGGIILGRQGIEEAYRNGEGKLRVRGVARIEDHSIIISEIPFQVRKSTLVESVANKVRSGDIDEISDLRDESDRDGIRIVIELKRGSNPQLVLTKLYKYTPLEWTFGANFLVIVDGNPRKLALRELLYYFLAHRREVVRRRTQFRLNAAQERAHLLEGMLKAIENRDEIIALISRSKDAAHAMEALQKRYKLSEKQADAILKMQLRRFTALESNELQEEYKEKQKAIKEYKEILASPHRLDGIIKEELLALKKRYSDARRTQILADVDGEPLSAEAFIPDTDLLISVSVKGYASAPKEEAYRKQQRGGKGILVMRLREGDAMKRVFTCHAKDDLLVFSKAHKAYKMKAYQLYSDRRDVKGENLRNFIGMEADEEVCALLPLHTDGMENSYCLMATAQGILNRNAYTDFYNAHTSGILAINPDSGDYIVDAAISQGAGEILLASAQGMTIRFKEELARCTGRPSKGVIGMRLNEGDRLIGLVTLEPGDPEDKLLLVTENGYGKRTPLEEFPSQGRGGKGVLGIKVDEKTGLIVAIEKVKDDDEIMVTTLNGKIIRISAGEVRIVGRYAKGVKLIDLDEGDKVVSVVRYVPGKNGELSENSAGQETAGES